MDQMPREETRHQPHASDGEEASQEVIAQHIVHCQDQEVLLVLTASGTCYVSLPNSCAVLGLNARGQLQRIQRTPQLLAGLRQLLVQTRGGSQRVNCLQLDSIAQWLSGIQGRIANAELEARADAYETLIREAVGRLIHPSSPTTIESMQPQPPSSRRDSSTSPLQQEQFSQQGLFEVDEVMGEELQERRSFLEVLPGITSAETLVTTSFQEDRAIREAGLARKNDWQEEPVSQRMRYIASNKLHVYLGDPEHPLSLAETIEFIRELGESTVLTARIILGLWNIQRCDQQLAKDGSAAIRVSDILEWRGVQKHSRPAYPGASQRNTDGYQWVHKQQVHRDLKLLELCYLHGYHTVNIEGKYRQIRIDGPYLRVASVHDTTDKTQTDLIGYFIAPGAWINTYEEHGNFFLAEIDRRIFQLHPQRDQIALRIALFLTEHWRQHLKTRSYADPIPMQDLLAASMVAIDHNHLTTRFAPRVEAALFTLQIRGIIAEARPLLAIDKTKAHWGKDWLQTPWSILPASQKAQPLLPHRNQEQATQRSKTPGQKAGS